MKVASCLQRILCLLLSTIFLFRDAIEERECQLADYFSAQLGSECHYKCHPEVGQLWEIEPFRCVLLAVLVDNDRVVQERNCD